MNKLKNKYRIALIAYVAGILFTSCVSLDEPNPGVQNPETFLQTQENAEAALSAAYAIQLTGGQYYNKRWVEINDIGSDEMGVGGTTSDAARNSYDIFVPQSDFDANTQMWWVSYVVINRTGFCVKNIPEMDPAVFEPKVQTRLVAEARFLRAQHYFHLIRLYGDVPFYGDNAIEATESLNKERTPVEEIYDFIISELEKAEVDLWDKATTPSGRIAKGAAQTLLAKVYLTRAGYRFDASTATMVKGDGKYWQLASDWCEKIMGSGGEYGLMENYRDVFPAGNHDEQPAEIAALNNNKEHILFLETKVGVRTTEFIKYWGPRDINDNAYSSFVGENEIYYMFDSVNDKRFETTYIDSIRYYEEEATVPIWNTDIFKYPFPHIGKFLPEDTLYLYPPTGQLSNTFKILFRYAEVLLMHAEAQNEINNGPTSEGIISFNAIRERAGLSLWPNVVNASDTNAVKSIFPDTYEGFKAAIEQERIFELCFEQKRRFDLLRWGTLVETFRNKLNKKEEDITPEDKLRAQNVRDYHNLLPIPQIDINTNTSLQQNPGY